MEAFGIRFAVADPQRFELLRVLYGEIKKDKDVGVFRNVKDWESLAPEEIKPRFIWITDRQRDEWAAVRNSRVTVVPEPADQLGGVWVFDRVFEAIEESEYDLLACELVSEGVAEIHINPHAYPYGGIGPFIALAEAFGFRVLGVNECGRYQPREELVGKV
jgi:hypothetical protein